VRTIHVIGCGKVGRTLARLGSEQGVWEVRGVLNRNVQSARRAVEFVGAGRAVERYAELGQADLVMIAASDGAIEGCCRRLCEAGNVGQGAIVFHCSGALGSAILGPARQRGAGIASVHPVKSFADPAAALRTFAGTYCALEGDPPACEVLGDLFRRLGAETFPIDPQHKTIYHAATVMVCNYLTALMEVGLRCFEKAGVPRPTAMNVMQPIVTGTVRNVFKLGPAAALTGPIARGETSVVAKQAEALGQWDERVERIYKALGQVAVELSAEQGNAAPEAIREVLRYLPPQPR
jgi:predicted short-subunit dehydrogenase-like oxidoreductase (DUF2520 family)